MTSTEEIPFPSSTNVELRYRREEDADMRLVHEMGYKQELYRGFSPLMSFAFCFTAVNVLTSISLGFDLTLPKGGSGVAIWSWVIGSIFTILVGLSLAEICSVYPSAGSVYHWTGQLVSAKRAPLASFICGWFNFTGNLAGYAVFASGFATIINAAIIVGDRPALSEGVEVAIAIGIAFIWAVQNALRIDQQGWLYTIAAFLQIASSIVIVIVLFSMSSNRATARDVFTTTYNGTGFPIPYVYCISIVSTLYSVSGYEAGAHLAEETRDARRAVPKGIVGTCVCNAILGIAYLLALLFAIPNVETFVGTNNSADVKQNLAVATFRSVLPKSAVMGLTVLLIINAYFAGMASLTVTSRIGFAMARDGVFPFSRYLRWIYQRTQTPLANVLLVFVVDALLLLLQLASKTVFTAIIAITTLGFQISYLMPILFRCTAARKTFPKGEFHLGRFGLPVAIISSIWLTITSIFMFFATEYPVTGDTMNYAVVVISGILLIAAIYWLISARHWFVGPKRTDTKFHLEPLEYMTKQNKTNEEFSLNMMVSRF